MDRTEEVKNVFLNAGQVNLPHSWKIICRGNSKTVAKEKSFGDGTRR